MWLGTSVREPSTSQRRGRWSPDRFPSHGRAWAHTATPASGAQSASRSLRNRCRQCRIDTMIEIAGVQRSPLHRSLQWWGSTDTTRNRADAWVRHHLPSKPVPSAVALPACGHGLRHQAQRTKSARHRLLPRVRCRPPNTGPRMAKLVTVAPWLAWCRLRHSPGDLAADRPQTGLWSMVRQTRSVARAFPPNSTSPPTHHRGWYESCQTGLPLGVRCLRTA